MLSGESSLRSSDEFEVEAITNDRIRYEFDEESGTYKDVKEYLIKWVGYKKKSWEPASNLDGCQQLLKNYINNKKKKDMKNNNISYNLRKRINNKRLKNYEKNISNGIDIDFDIDIENSEIESPIKKAQNDNYTSNNDYENSKNDNLPKDLVNKKRKRKDSNFSISIDDSHMKTDSNSKLNQNEISNLNQSNNNKNINISIDNNGQILGITQVTIPKNKNDPICIYYKTVNENKIISVEEASNNIKMLSQRELINCYERILKHYLGGKRLIFNNGLNKK